MDYDVIAKRKKIVEYFFDKSTLISEELLAKIERGEFDNLREIDVNEKAAVLTGHKKLDFDLKNNTSCENDLISRHCDENSSSHFLDCNGSESNVKVLFSYNAESIKREAQHFVKYFNKRYNTISNILKCRRELQSTTSIARILAKKDKESVAVIGMVKDKGITKSGHISIVLEDVTGEITVLVNKNKQDCYDLAKDISLDEVIGVVGANSERLIFVNKLFLPDIPLSKELKKSPDEAYALFLSDLHVGSDMFLPDEFEKFLKWINCDLGSEGHKSVASKVKYIFIAGDLVDGIGIYPGQEEELIIKEISEQYRVCAEYLKKIPSHIKIIICPGNHDAMRIAEPQPALYKDFAGPLWKLPNVVMVSNPALVNIHSSKDFPGFDVLLYHGFSFDYYIANVGSIRTGGGYDRGDLVMKHLLQRRHLAPTHASTLYIPDTESDPLIITKVPDFFVTGHIHKTAASNYRNVTMICGSCWQARTSFQIKVGHHPEPARVPIVNLQTRKVKILKFGDKDG